MQDMTHLKKSYLIYNTNSSFNWREKYKTWCCKINHFLLCYYTVFYISSYKWNVNWNNYKCFGHTFTGFGIPFTRPYIEKMKVWKYWQQQGYRAFFKKRKRVRGAIKIEDKKLSVIFLCLLSFLIKISYNKNKDVKIYD